MVKLDDYTIAELKKMVSSWRKEGIKFAGYSKMKKAELIDMIKSNLNVEEGDNAVKLSIIPSAETELEPESEPDYTPESDPDYMKSEYMKYLFNRITIEDEETE